MTCIRSTTVHNGNTAAKHLVTSPDRHHSQTAAAAATAIYSGS